MSLEVGSPALRLVQQPSSLVLCGPEAISLGGGWPWPLLVLVWGHLLHSFDVAPGHPIFDSVARSKADYHSSHFSTFIAELA